MWVPWCLQQLHSLLGAVHGYVGYTCSVDGGVGAVCEVWGGALLLCGVWAGLGGVKDHRHSY